MCWPITTCLRGQCNLSLICNIIYKVIKLVSGWVRPKS